MQQISKWGVPAFANLLTSVCSSVIFLVSWTADLPFADFPFFVFFCPSFACLSVHLSSLFLVCCLFIHLFFWPDLDESQYPSLEREGAIRIVSYSGKIEGSDSHDEGLRKILYQALT